MKCRVVLPLWFKQLTLLYCKNISVLDENVIALWLIANIKLSGGESLHLVHVCGSILWGLEHEIEGADTTIPFSPAFPSFSFWNKSSEVPSGGHVTEIAACWESMSDCAISVILSFLQDFLIMAQKEASVQFIRPSNSVQWRKQIFCAYCKETRKLTCLKCHL